MPLGATYRLQLNGFGLAAARDLLPYLDDLGIETLYVSPVTEAAPGSTHGYDVVDPTRVDPALGGPGALAALLDELGARGMQLLVDVVPNHMAVSAANRAWWDVLRHGPASAHAATFDIDWAAHGGRVLVAVLGAPLAEVVADGGLSVVDEDGEVRLAYAEHRFPLAPGSERPPGPLDRRGAPAVLAAQHYRLAHWRLGRRQGNVRRFFDIDTLAGVRMEDPAVYRATHRLVLDLAADRRVAGLRLDHVDGLADPAGYLRRLRADVDAARPDGAAPPVLLVEKITARGEAVPAGWPVDGATGYEFGDLAIGLLVAPGSGDPGFAELARAAKREVQATLFPGQVRRLATLAAAAVEADEPGADADPADMEAAVVELTAQLDVYRTYLGAGPPSAEDRRRLADAAGRAAARLDAEGRRLAGALCRGLLERADPGAPGPGDAGGRWTEVARRFQQLTGAVAAKGVEDTALYRTAGPAAAADVGGDPGGPAVSVADFHAAMEERHRTGASALNATSTHDAKRGEDVRTRLAVLTEWSGWAALVDRWHRAHRRLAAVELDPLDERRVYEATLGLWPRPRAELVDRVRAYAVKAAREAKRRTSWAEPDPGYEDALEHFVAAVLDPGRPPFGGEMDEAAAAVGPAAAANALALLVLKMTAPGVPDTYQGTEVWAPSLVDPDNRRPLDVGRLARALAGLGPAVGPPAAGGLDRFDDGRLKLDVTRRLLALRRRQRWLEVAAYRALEVRGPAAGHAVAFARHGGGGTVVTVVTRLPLTLAGAGRPPVGKVWEGTTVSLPAGTGPLTDVLGGGATGAVAGGATLPLAELLETLPVAVLTRPDA